jgi:hypothetical protein
VCQTKADIVHGYVIVIVDCGAARPSFDVIVKLQSRTVTEDECKSLQGHIVMRQHGPIAWGLQCEQRVSGLSCEAEIKAVDEGTKTPQFIRFLEAEHGSPSIATPLFNDNSGAVQWSLAGKVTKTLRHVNIREFCVRDARKAKAIAIRFSRATATLETWNLLTKEHKSTEL